MMYLGWYDPDKKKSATDKANEAIEAFVEKFPSEDATNILCSPSDFEEIASNLGGQYVVGAEIFIPWGTYYIGIVHGDA